MSEGAEGRPALRVVEPDIKSIQDIPRLLRELAERIDSGELEAVKAVICMVTQEDEIVVMGLGRVLSNVEAVGLFHIGADTLSEMVRSDGEE